MRRLFRPSRRNTSRNASGTGVAQTMIVLGVVYFIWMFVGSLIVGESHKTGGNRPAMSRRPLSQTMITLAKTSCSNRRCWTPQFYLLWLVLCLNVTAGIGVYRPSLAHDPRHLRSDGRRGGRVRRADQPLQYGRPNLLGVALGFSSGVSKPTRFSLLWVPFSASSFGTDVGASCTASYSRAYHFC